MEEWVQVSPSSGSGDGEVTVTLQENTSEEDRSTQITIKVVSLQQVIQILQKGNAMNHYKIQPLDETYELYKFNPSTGEETLLSTKEEYTTVMDELLALKAWLYLNYTLDGSSNLTTYIASCCIEITSYPQFFPGIRVKFFNSTSVSNGTTTLKSLEVSFGINSGESITKPQIKLNKEHTHLFHLYRIMLGNNQDLPDYSLEDIPVKNIIDGETNQEVTYPFTFRWGVEYPVFELYSEDIRVSNSLTESPFSNINLNIPLQISRKSAYNGSNPETIFYGIINSNIFDGPQKIEAIINQNSQILSVSDLKFTISPLIPSSTETV